MRKKEPMFYPVKCDSGPLFMRSCARCGGVPGVVTEGMYAGSSFTPENFRYNRYFIQCRCCSHKSKYDLDKRESVMTWNNQQYRRSKWGALAACISLNFALACVTITATIIWISH